MRRRLRNFLPIVLLALVVQILAPIGACFAASIVASDPLHGAAICSGGADTTGQSDQGGGQHRAHHGSCSICCVAHAGGSLDTPQAAFTTPYRQAGRVVWRDSPPDLFGCRAGSHAQARAPPSIS
jgi:hypothetical protein